MLIVFEGAGRGRAGWVGWVLVPPDVCCCFYYSGNLIGEKGEKVFASRGRRKKGSERFERAHSYRGINALAVHGSTHRME